jgi:hypothetical protein
MTVHVAEHATPRVIPPDRIATDLAHADRAGIAPHIQALVEELT